MSDRYWLVHANGGRQLIDPDHFDLAQLVEQAKRYGGRLELETYVDRESSSDASPFPACGFQPPVAAIGPMLRQRVEQIYAFRVDYTLQVIDRPTKRSLGAYYRSRRLIRLYSHDAETGQRPFEELFETFIHELAHHLEYTEFDEFQAEAWGRRPGTMHSQLFWRILGELKARWADLQRSRR